MSSQAQIMARTNSLGDKQFKFWLQNASEGLLLLDIAPDGWVKNEVEYKRSKKYRGVFRSVSVAELTFFKAGRDFIKNVYETQGIDAKILLIVKKLNLSTYDYDDYHTGKVDLATYKINETGATVNLVDSSFNEKVINREKIKIDLLKRVSVDGVAVPAFISEPQIVKVNEFEIIATSTWDGSGIESGDTGDEHPLPYDLVFGDEMFEAQSQTGSANTKLGSFYNSAVHDTTISISGNIAGTLSGTPSPVVTIRIEAVVIDSDENVTASRLLFTAATDESGSGSFDQSFSDSIEISEGYSIIIQGDFTQGTSIDVNYTDISMTATEVEASVSDTNVGMFGYYEAFLRVCQILTDEQNPFYSDFFGRTDTPLTTYLSDGEIGYLTKGVYFRGTPYLNKTIPVSLFSLFESMSAIFSIGLCIEQISSVDKVRIEALSYFFDENVIIDVSDKIRTEDIEKAVIPDRYYNSVQVGFNKFDYDEFGGLFEYNTTSEFTTPIQSVNLALKSVSSYRGDFMGMVKLLSSDKSLAEDEKGDGDIFVLDALRDGGDMIAQTSEGFDSVTGGAGADLSFNLNYAPARSLRRKGSWLKAGLLHNLSDYLRFQTNDKNTTLVTDKPAESPVTEQADILVNDLASPIWLNEKYTIKVNLSTTEKAALDSNMHGIIKIDSDKYGWVLEVKTSNEDNMSEMELLRVNTSEVTPVEL